MARNRADRRRATPASTLVVVQVPDAELWDIPLNTPLMGIVPARAIVQAPQSAPDQWDIQWEVPTGADQPGESLVTTYGFKVVDADAPPVQPLLHTLPLPHYLRPGYALLVGLPVDDPTDVLAHIAGQVRAWLLLSPAQSRLLPHEPVSPIWTLRDVALTDRLFAGWNDATWEGMRLPRGPGCRLAPAQWRDDLRRVVATHATRYTPDLMFSQAGAVRSGPGQPGRPGDRSAARLMRNLANNPAVSHLLLGMDWGRVHERLYRANGPSWPMVQIRPFDHRDRSYGTPFDRPLDELLVTAHVAGSRAIALRPGVLSTWACIDLDYGHGLGTGMPQETYDRLLTSYRADVALLLRLFPEAMIEARFIPPPGTSPLWPISPKKYSRSMFSSRLYGRPGAWRHLHPDAPGGFIRGVHVWIRWNGWYPTDQLRTFLTEVLRWAGVGTHHASVQGTDPHLMQGIDIFPRPGHAMALPLRAEAFPSILRAKCLGLGYTLVDAALVPRISPMRTESKFLDPSEYLARQWALINSSWNASRLPGAPDPLGPDEVRLVQQASIPLVSRGRLQGTRELWLVFGPAAMPQELRAGVVVGRPIPYRVRHMDVEGIQEISRRTGIREMRLLESLARCPRVPEGPQRERRVAAPQPVAPRPGPVEEQAPVQVAARHEPVGRERPLDVVEMELIASGPAVQLIDGGTNPAILALIQQVRRIGGDLASAQEVGRRVNASRRVPRAHGWLEGRISSVYQASMEREARGGLRPLTGQRMRLTEPMRQRVRDLVEQAYQADVPGTRKQATRERWVTILTAIAQGALAHPTRWGRWRVVASFLEGHGMTNAKSRNQFREWLTTLFGPELFEVRSGVSVDGPNVHAYDITAFMEGLATQPTRDPLS